MIVRPSGGKRGPFVIQPRQGRGFSFGNIARIEHENLATAEYQFQNSLGILKPITPRWDVFGQLEPLALGRFKNISRAFKNLSSDSFETRKCKTCPRIKIENLNCWPPACWLADTISTTRSSHTDYRQHALKLLCSSGQMTSFVNGGRAAVELEVLIMTKPTRRDIERVAVRGRSGPFVIQP